MNNTQTSFYGNEKPNYFSIGDLWISESAIHVAQKQNDEVVWVFFDKR